MNNQTLLNCGKPCMKKTVGDEPSNSFEKRLKYADNRILESRYIGWKILEESWTETRSKILMQQSRAILMKQNQKGQMQ